MPRLRYCASLAPPSTIAQYDKNDRHDLNQSMDQSVNQSINRNREPRNWAVACSNPLPTPSSPSRSRHRATLVSDHSHVRGPPLIQSSATVLRSMECCGRMTTRCAIAHWAGGHPSLALSIRLTSLWCCRRRWHTEYSDHLKYHLHFHFHSTVQHAPGTRLRDTTRRTARKPTHGI